MLLRGQVIRSEAGRDKGYLMSVVASDDKYVYVCDGKERRLASPKRKNPKHIKVCGCVLNEAQLHSDKALRIALAQTESNNE